MAFCFLSAGMVTSTQEGLTVDLWRFVSCQLVW